MSSKLNDLAEKLRRLGKKRETLAEAVKDNYLEIKNCIAQMRDIMMASDVTGIKADYLYLDDIGRR